MSRLSKAAWKQHNEAVALLKQDILTSDEREFVISNWREDAEHDVGGIGSFFTPMAMANDFAVDAGFALTNDSSAPLKILDLCAGIGRLGHEFKKRYPNAEITCVERNHSYYDVGRKVFPEADWYCHDASDVDFLRSLGNFDAVIGNPPFGVCSVPNKPPRYTGAAAEFKFIDAAAEVAEYGVFIVRQQISPFKFSGVRSFMENASEEYDRFRNQTGIEFDYNMGIDCCSLGTFRGAKQVVVEFVHADFRHMKMNKAAEHTSHQQGFAF